MTGWSDIVTAALLGTGRRPLPAELPPWAAAAGLDDAGDAEHRVLDLAAAHRVAAQAGRTADSSRAWSAGPTAVPKQRLPPAPPAARRMLDESLIRPDATTIGYWLAACARHGCGLDPGHWAVLAGLAARSTAYDRAALSAALGERGRWFVHQNPDWHKLATALDAAAVEPGSGGGPPVPAAATAEQVERDPELLLAVADPWPDSLVTAALVGLLGGRMGTSSGQTFPTSGSGRAPSLRTYARTLGARLSHAQYAGLGMLAQRFLELPQLGPAERRGVRNLFVEIERAAYDRIEIERAFDPSLERISTITIPPV
jgi:hypothetical protein